MKYFTFISLIIFSFSVSGQEEISRGLLNDEIKDSIFQQLLIENNLIDILYLRENEDLEKVWKVSNVLICPQINNDTLYLVLKENYRTDSIRTTQVRSRYFLFDKNGKRIKIYKDKSSLGGYALDLNSDGKNEIIDSHYIMVGKSCCSGKSINYLYTIPIQSEPTTTFGIIFNFSWHWKIVDLNNDQLFEIQIGPTISKLNASMCHNSEMLINPKVTFYWSIEENKYYTTDTEYMESYRILDFEIPENCKKAERKFHRILNKF